VATRAGDARSTHEDCCLKSIEEILALPVLPTVSSATDLRDLFMTEYFPCASSMSLTLASSLQGACMSMKTELAIPELMLIAATRGMLGAGIGLLVADKLTDRHRKTVGTALVAVGALSTVPLLLMVFKRRRPVGSHSGSGGGRHGKTRAGVPLS